MNFLTFAALLALVLAATAQFQPSAESCGQYNGYHASFDKCQAGYASFGCVFEGLGQSCCCVPADPSGSSAPKAKAKSSAAYGRECVALGGVAVDGEGCPVGQTVLLQPKEIAWGVLGSQVCCSNAPLPGRKPANPPKTPSRFETYCASVNGAIQGANYPCRRGEESKATYGDRQCCVASASAGPSRTDQKVAKYEAFVANCRRVRGAIQAFCAPGQGSHGSAEKPAADGGATLVACCTAVSAAQLKYDQFVDYCSREGGQLQALCMPGQLGLGGINKPVDGGAYITEACCKDEAPVSNAEGEYQLFEADCADRMGEILSSCPSTMTTLSTGYRPTRTGQTSVACCKPKPKTPAKPSTSGPKPSGTGAITSAASLQRFCAQANGAIQGRNYPCQSGEEQMAYFGDRQCCVATSSFPFEQACARVNGAIQSTSYSCRAGEEVKFVSGNRQCCGAVSAGPVQHGDAPIQPNLDNFATDACTAKGGVVFERCDAPLITVGQESSGPCCADSSAANRNAFKSYAKRCFERRGMTLVNQACPRGTLIPQARVGALGTVACCVDA